VIPLSDLKQAISVPPEVGDILGATSTREAKPESLQQSSLVFAGNKLKPGVSSALLVDGLAPADVFNSYLHGNLGSKSINFEGPTPSNGGVLYTVYASKKLYVLIIPSTSGGSVLTLWNIPPQ